MLPEILPGITNNALNVLLNNDFKAIQKLSRLAAKVLYDF